MTEVNCFQVEGAEKGHPGGELGPEKPTDPRRRATSAARVPLGRSRLEKLRNRAGT